MLRAIDIVEKSNPDIIDINFGCPVKKVVSKGAGAGILKDVCLMEKLTAEMVKRTNLPVTVKTRLGWDHNSIQIVEVAERLQDVGCKAVFLFMEEHVHKCIKVLLIGGLLPRLRTTHVCIFQFLEMAMLTLQRRAIEMRDKYGLDGAMIGRATIGNPWFFKQVKHFMKTGQHLEPINMLERVEAARRHLQMAIDWKGEVLGVLETRRHYTNYFKGIADFKPFRTKMVTSDLSSDVFSTLDEVESVFGEYQFT